MSLWHAVREPQIMTRLFVKTKKIWETAEQKNYFIEEQDEKE